LTVSPRFRFLFFFPRNLVADGPGILPTGLVKVLHNCELAKMPFFCVAGDRLPLQRLAPLPPERIYSSFGASAQSYLFLPLVSARRLKLDGVLCPRSGDLKIVCFGAVLLSQRAPTSAGPLSFCKGRRTPFSFPLFLKSLFRPGLFLICSQVFFFPLLRRSTSHRGMPLPLLLRA